MGAAVQAVIRPESAVAVPEGRYILNSPFGAMPHEPPHELMHFQYGVPSEVVPKP